MTPLVQDNIARIQDICKTFGVQKMFVFGSAARGEDFDAESDIDLLYKLNPEVRARPVEEQPDFFEMLFSLEELFGRKVDLIDLTRVKNPYLIQGINQCKLKLYEA